jgi:lipoic acid synthetase
LPIDDITETLSNLKGCGCDIILIGQYLRPSNKQIEVSKYYSLEEFVNIKEIGNKIGLLTVAGPFVRTSYNAKALYNNLKKH